MDVTPLIKKGQQIIQAYVGGSFRISGVEHEGAVFVVPTGTKPWPLTAVSFEELEKADFERLLPFCQGVDLIIIGTGGRHRFISLDIISTFKSLKISVDFMDTGSACRTYNALMAEGRRVAAALFPVGSA